MFKPSNTKFKVFSATRYLSDTELEDFLNDISKDTEIFKLELIKGYWTAICKVKK